MGETALQAAWEWNPLSSEEARRAKLLKLLIDHGAEVNAPSAKHDGMIALDSAARQGDLRTAVLLLKHGADRQCDII
jgi:ankyrin repeat protein